MNSVSSLLDFNSSRETGQGKEVNNRESSFRYYSLIMAGICFFVYFLELLNNNVMIFLGLKASLFFIRPWTIISSIFVHSLQDQMHLLNNMFFLLIFGYMLERTIGSRKFVLLFLASGIFANFSAFIFYFDSLVVGASGAISAIVLTMAVLKPRTMGFAYGAVMPMWAVAIIWFISNSLLMLGDVGSIAAEAHIFGAAFGLLTGLYFRSQFEFSEEKEQEENIDQEEIDSWEEKYMGS